MFQTSLDLLYLGLFVAVALVAIFLCLVLLYLALMVKNVYEVFRSFRKKMDLLDEVLKTLKEKIEHSATYLGLLVEGVGKLVEYLKEKKEKQKEKKKAKVVEE